MKRNPGKPKIVVRNKIKNASNTLETVKIDDFKYAVANMDYAQGMKRSWRDNSTGSGKAQ